MFRITRLHRGSGLILSATLALLFALVSSSIAFANETLIRISSDPYTNSTSQHKTQVEPDVYSFGSTVAATFQSGPLLTIAAQPGRMDFCPVPQCMQHRLDHMLAPVIRRLPTIPNMGSG